MAKQRNTGMRKFRRSDLAAVRGLLVKTMEKSFADVYPRSAIEYFKSHHLPEHILADAKGGHTVVVERGGRIVATGTLAAGKIGRVYVDPGQQGTGLGRRVMTHLEERARAEGLGIVLLHSTLVARPFYESLGYFVRAAKSLTMDDGARLNYYNMAKRLPAVRSRGPARGGEKHSG